MSSSFHSTGDAPTQRVPAWKRLGLKLKPASEAQSDDATHHPAPGSSSVPNSRAPHLSGSSSTPNAKRRASGGPVPALDHSAKRARQDNQTSSHLHHQTPPAKKPKAVSFAADTAGGLQQQQQQQAPVPAKKTKPQKKQQTPTPPKGAINATAAAPAKPTKKSPAAAPVNLEPALAYLRTWHTSRETWKFNKNHQTKLLEQVFAGADSTTIPAADIAVFYEYIRGLQGNVRVRLRELANGIKAEDMEQGASGFPSSIAANSAGKEMAERKQREYEEVIRTFLSQARTPQKEEEEGDKKQKQKKNKRRFDEVDYVLRTTDMEMQRRVVKRMRAEMVLDELSETDASEASTTTATGTATTTSGESSTSTEKGRNSASEEEEEEDEEDDEADANDADTGDNHNKRLKLNDGPQQRTKRKRKLRTAAVEDDTSSESESESESEADTSSDGSSSNSDSSSGSDSDSDSEEGTPGNGRVNEDTSSSSSSSSSSGSESDSDDDDD
ncbi:hypothetical protein F5Y09DRAFT_304073 [Xylaria sp. FL1042]|nr:hypothetical protein F5Y09DRAFT_304073 [Xylaria sp. FL1042]